MALNKSSSKWLPKLRDHYTVFYGNRAASSVFMVGEMRWNSKELIVDTEKHWKEEENPIFFLILLFTL